ncbi:MAG TPA: hypothetical protein PLS55_14850, partial [Thermogutta sp.]|nr:hypothetical protein [Thermogutta sp.]
FAAQGNFDAADQFIARLEKNRPAVLQSNKVQAARTRLEEARAKENQRRGKFEETRKTLERAIADGNPAQQDVKLLSDLARDEKEKLIAQDIERRAQEKWREQDRKARESWKQRMAALEERIRQLEAKDISFITEKDVEEVERLYHELVNDTTISDDSLKDTAKPLLARVGAIKSRLEKFKQDLQRLEPLISAIGRRGAFEASLREIARDDRFRYADQCAKMANALPWDAVDSWNNVANLWNGNRDNLDPAKAKQLVKAVEKSGHPPVENEGWKEFFERKWLPYVEAVSRRDEAAMKEILKSWQAPFVRETYRTHALEATGETIIYSKEDPRSKIAAKVFGVSALVPDDPFGGSMPEIMRTLSEPSFCFADISPQRRLCEELDASLQAIVSSSGNMEALACELLVKMTESQEKAKRDWALRRGSAKVPDPSLRIPVNDYIFARLFVDTVTAVSALSPVFAEHWNPVIKDLKADLAKCGEDWMLYEPNWTIDPSKPAPRMPLRLPTLRDIEAVAECTIQTLEKIRQPLPSLRWVGFVYYLDEDASKPRLCGLKDFVPPHTILLGVPSTGSSSPSARAFRVIAVVNSSLGLDWQYKSVPFGMPVFEFEGMLDLSGNNAEQ